MSKIDKSIFFKFVARNDVATCLKIIESQFDFKNCTSTYGSRNVCMDSSIIPESKPNTKFLAFSTYRYLVDAMNNKLDVDEKEHGKLVRSSNFKSATKELCSEKTEEHSLTQFGDEYVQNSCFRALYMQTLLTKGYGFKRWNEIRFVSKVKGQSVGWTLGYMLEESNKIPSIETIQNQTHVKFHQINRKYFVCKTLSVLCGFAVCIFVFASMCWCKNCCWKMIGNNNCDDRFSDQVI